MKIKNFITTALLSASVLFFVNEVNAQLYWNKACTFAGNSTSYVRVPNSSLLDITGSFTLEAWINPVLSGAASKGIISKGGALGTSLRYGMRLSVSGRLMLLINGAQRLITKSSTVIQDSMWTHVCATFSHFTNTHSIYINGVLDTSAVFAGTLPSSNADSLFIGISGASTPFNGQLDEVRVWARELTSAEVAAYYRTSLGTSTGIYSALVLSMTFQRENNNNPFTFKDLSDYLNHGIGRNVSEFDMSHKPYHTISTNESVLLDGTDDYLSGKDDAQAFPAGDFTFESWIYPRDANLSQIFRKTAGAVTAFSVLVSGTEIKSILNNVTSSAPVSLTLNQWHHVAASYKSSSGVLGVYLNGTLVGNHFLFTGSIPSSTDSIYIGGNPGSGEFFNGYIDEVRISGVSNNVFSIRQLMYTGLEYTGGTDNITSLTSYKFDGNTFDCGLSEGPKLGLRNNARFSHPSGIAGVPRSPLLKGEDAGYPGSYYLKTLNLRVPAAGTSGNITNSYGINLNQTITDLDVYVVLNHTKLSNIKITLAKQQTPDSIVIFDGSISNSTDNNLALIFDDDADSILKNNTYSSFCSPIKPLNSIEALFNGKSTLGSWMIRITDISTGDTGMFYSWGIKFNNQDSPEINLTVSAFVQGYYNPATDFTIQDTLTAELRSASFPFSIEGISKRKCSSTGTLYFSFPEIQIGNSYFLIMKHRNSIETWSSNPVALADRFGSIYNFQNLITFAFGNNMIQVDNTPVKFAFYGGDVNQDDIVDGTDGVLIDNDAAIFNTGYLVTDLNGDEVIDGSDAVIADNNAANFVSAFIP